MISCVAPLTITSASLKFGRYDDATCPDATVNSETPYNSTTVNLTAAVGQSSYILDTSSPFDHVSRIGGLVALLASLGFGDPDPGVYKQYTLTYTCGTTGGYVCNQFCVSNMAERTLADCTCLMAISARSPGCSALDHDRHIVM